MTILSHMITGACRRSLLRMIFSVHSSKMNSQSFYMHLSSTGNFLFVKIIDTISFHSLCSIQIFLNCFSFYRKKLFCQYFFKFLHNPLKLHMTFYYINTTHHLNIKAKGNISTIVSKVLLRMLFHNLARLWNKKRSCISTQDL